MIFRLSGLIIFCVIVVFSSEAVSKENFVCKSTPYGVIKIKGDLSTGDVHFEDSSFMTVKQNGRITFIKKYKHSISQLNFKVKEDKVINQYTEALINKFADGHHELSRAVFLKEKNSDKFHLQLTYPDTDLVCAGLSD